MTDLSSTLVRAHHQRCQHHLQRYAAGYRLLLQEAGLLGQSLYLEAEAAGHRGTGIGCFFGDALHELLGITGSRLQTLYHFTLGSAIDDARITSKPPYPASEPGDSA